MTQITIICGSFETHFGSSYNTKTPNIEYNNNMSTNKANSSVVNSLMNFKNVERWPTTSFWNNLLWHESEISVLIYENKTNILDR